MLIKRDVQGAYAIYHRKKGWGFIEASEDRTNYWFHLMQVVSRKTPRIGMRVIFDIAHNEKGISAVNVREVAVSVVPSESGASQNGGVTC